MNRRAFVASVAAALGPVGDPAWAFTPKPSLRDKLATRAEASGYAEVTPFADVQALLATLDQRGAPLVRKRVARTEEGRIVPFVVASRPRIVTPQAAHALRRPVVMLFAGLHGGEVDGTEALLSVLRDLCLSTDKTLLEDVVLLVMPLVNPDGYERRGAQSDDRPEQNGPERVGVPDNGKGVDLDGDFVKAQASETRGILRVMRQWKPDVTVELRTGGGSYQAYPITFAPSLHPAAGEAATYARDSLIGYAHKQLRETFGILSFPIGHFGRNVALAVPPPPGDTTDYGWFTDDYRTRHATNYAGVRGVLAVRGETYQHDPFDRRVGAARAFLEVLLGAVADKGDAVVAAAGRVRRRRAVSVSLRAAFPERPPRDDVVQWEPATLETTVRHQAGMPPGYMRGGTLSSATMPVFDRFVSTLDARAPAGYLVASAAAAATRALLDAHDVAYEIVARNTAFTVSTYTVASVTRGDAFEATPEFTVTGAWSSRAVRAAQGGELFVSLAQTHGVLAATLLEPESADGFATWNAFGVELAAGSEAPVRRVLQ